MTRTRRPASDPITEAIGPRQVGGTYLCAYWRMEYTVLAIDRNPAGPFDWSITVRNADGGVKTHSTAWDRRDKVINQPTTTAS